MVLVLVMPLWLILKIIDSPGSSPGNCGQCWRLQVILVLDLMGNPGPSPEYHM